MACWRLEDTAGNSAVACRRTQVHNPACVRSRVCRLYLSSPLVRYANSSSAESSRCRMQPRKPRTSALLELTTRRTKWELATFKSGNSELVEDAIDRKWKLQTRSRSLFLHAGRTRQSMKWIMAWEKRWSRRIEKANVRFSRLCIVCKEGLCNKYVRTVASYLTATWFVASRP